MRIAVAALAIGLASCGPNEADVIRDICIPNNEQRGFDLAQAARERGYDVSEVRAICRDWFQEGLREFSRKARRLGGDEGDPYATEP